MRTHLDLFSGIGGFALAAHWNGLETVAFSETEPYATAILEKHWPNVPNLGDIKNVTRRTLADAIGSRQLEQERRLGEIRRRPRDSSKTEAATPGPAHFVDLLTGGFPCQPFSFAGKRRGAGDDRALWPEMFRVISEIAPAWVLAENVPGIINMELDRCISDLESIGYSVLPPLVIPACALDAKHRRDRVWIVANARCGRRTGQAEGKIQLERRTETLSPGETIPDADPLAGRTRRPAGPETRHEIGNGRETLADTEEGRIRRRNAPRDPGQPPFSGETLADTDLPRLERRNRRGAEEHAAQITSRPSNSPAPDAGSERQPTPRRREQSGGQKPDNEGETDISKPNDSRLAQSGLGGIAHGIPGRLDGVTRTRENWRSGEWEAQTPRTAAGVKRRGDRLKGLGNAIVPQLAAEIIRLMIQFEDR